VNDSITGRPHGRQNHDLNERWKAESAKWVGKKKIHTGDWRCIEKIHMDMDGNTANDR
jgi:hypothetical protein